MFMPFPLDARQADAATSAAKAAAVAMPKGDDTAAADPVPGVEQGFGEFFGPSPKTPA